jgi:Domain of unknown function (DUF4398)
MFGRDSFGLRAACLCSLFLLVACGTPPSREMDQAQGAIDAARAAGADRYAAEQYGAAVKALENAHNAVAQRDYRLALNHALDSRDRAQNAAKEAASQQAVLRSGAERRLGQVTALLDQTRKRLASAESARVPRRALSAARVAIGDAERSLQEAGTDIQEGNYRESQDRLAESAKKLQTAIAEIETATKGRGKARR